MAYAQLLCSTCQLKLKFQKTIKKCKSKILQLKLPNELCHKCASMLAKTIYRVSCGCAALCYLHLHRALIKVQQPIIAASFAQLTGIESAMWKHKSNQNKSSVPIDVPFSSPSSPIIIYSN